jgi:4'-phosphopantetheinyl transferase EntD
VIEEILPPRVEAVEVFGDLSDPPLFPEEAAHIQRAVATRRAEFTTVRCCARRALAALGIAPAPILPGLRGAPSWPAGVVGSMTHCSGYRAAAVAPAADLLTVGIDAEVHDALPAGVLATVARDEEHHDLRQLAATAPHVHWDRLLFSAKEAVYKAWFPLTRRWLDFSEARVTLHLAGTFRAQLLVPGPLAGGTRISEFAGRWVARDGVVLTAISTAHPGRA